MKEDGYGRTELDYAIINHRTEDALELLKCCDNINHQDIAGYSYLFFAAQQGELEVLEELLKLGADPNIEDAVGGTPLKSALEASQVYSEERAFQMVKRLLEAGADPDKQEGHRRTVRQIAKYLAPGKISDYLSTYGK